MTSPISSYSCITCGNVCGCEDITDQEVDLVTKNKPKLSPDCPEKRSTE